MLNPTRFDNALNTLGAWLLARYPAPHGLRTDRALPR